MWKDELVEEIRKVREDYAAKFEFDLDSIALDLQEQQKLGNRQVVNLDPHPPLLEPTVKVS
jgi:hypothetical protein